MAINGINGLRYVGVGIQKAAERLNRNMSLIRFPPGEIEINFLQQLYLCEKAIKAIKIQKKRIEEELKKEADKSCKR